MTAETFKSYSIGAPPDDPPAPPPLAKATARPSAAFEEYVLRYSRVQRNNIFLASLGVVAVIGAMFQLDGAALVMGAALGVGFVLGGSGAFIVTGAAHSAYTRHMAAITTETYQEPAPAGPAVRPFVPSKNAEHTIRAGRFTLPAATWAALFAAAEAAGGRLTRDAAQKVLPRALYRGWAETLGELQRLGLVDQEGRILPAGWISVLSPHPNGATPPAGAYSTHAPRTPGTPGEAV